MLLSNGHLVLASLFWLSAVMSHYEDIWGNEGIAPPFLIFSLDRSEQSASHPCHFTCG
jgi:hypothetical protein